MDKDIQEIFREKNREILITNLKFDLEKNINSLVETVTNIFDLEFNTAISKINAVFGDASISKDKMFAERIVNLMRDKNYKNISKFIKDKKELLLNNIDILEFTEEEMNKYYEIVFDSTKTLKDSLNKEFRLVIEENSKKLNDYILENVSSENKELTITRIDDYLENRLYGKLETKIHMEIMLRDNNLINKAKEVYLRYQDICSKTMSN